VRQDGRGLGLVSLEERAHLLGGVLAIATRPGSGTTIRVRVPAGGCWQDIADEGRAGIEQAPPFAFQTEQPQS
jgi:signal transduction histidine kinase